MTPRILFVHGSWHGPWCWERTRAILRERGIETAAVQLPSCTPALGDLDADSAAIVAAARDLGGAVTVVAHSYGGVPTTHAAFGPEVRELVYLGAFMPPAGRSLVDLLPPGPLPPYVTVGADGLSHAVQDQVGALLYGDCSAEDIAWAKSRLVPQNAAVVATPVGGASWERVPSTYLLLTQDLAVPVEAQRAFASQARRTIELEASHSPFLSKPAALAALLAEVATDAAR